MTPTMKMWKLTLGNFYIKPVLKIQLNLHMLKRAIYLYLKKTQFDASCLFLHCGHVG